MIMIMKKNVLIIAYACEPGKTSEPGVGWNFSKEIIIPELPPLPEIPLTEEDK